MVGLVSLIRGAIHLSIDWDVSHCFSLFPTVSHCFPLFPTSLQQAAKRPFAQNLPTGNSAQKTFCMYNTYIRAVSAKPPVHSYNQYHG